MVSRRINWGQDVNLQIRRRVLLRDIILFGVSVGVLCLYFAFLLYEWFLNKNKMPVETDKKYNFVLPAANRILSVLQERFHPGLKEETLKRYRKLYVGKSDDDIKHDYYIKHISVFLYMLLICQVLFLVTLLSCQNDHELISGYYIEKNDIGGEQKDIKVETKIGGLKKELDISVPERKYSDEEIKIQSEKVKKYIYSHYLGKNKSSDKVCKNLYLMKKVKGSMFVISWISDDEKIISEQGKVYGSRISNPRQVGLTAVIKYESFKEKLRFNVIVTPVKKGNEQSIWDELDKLLSDAMERTKSFKYFKLPEKVAGKKVKYGINRYEPLWRLTAVMAVMFIVVPYLLESMVKSRVSDREKQLKLAYPEMIEKFVLLVNAGLPVKNAWIRITETESEKTKDNNYRDNFYLVEEMLLTKRQMENGLSEEKAYEMFGRRIGLLSYMKFCTLLVQNMKKGTADLIRILEYESADVFNERKENVKILGEEVGTKLLIPMMIMMVIIFAIILYAAFAGM